MAGVKAGYTCSIYILSDKDCDYDQDIPGLSERRAIMPPATAHSPVEAPSPWIARFAPLIPRGIGGRDRVLDLAAGSGRHTRLLLDRGHPVLAVDRDTSRLGSLTGRENLEILAADLESEPPWRPEGPVFAGVVVTNYLWRPLLPLLPGWLQDAGVLIYETFACGNERFGRPRNPAHLLEAGELLEAVRGRLQVIAYEHGAVSAPRPAVIQRIVAVKDADDRPLSGP